MIDFLKLGLLLVISISLFVVFWALQRWVFNRVRESSEVLNELAKINCKISYKQIEQTYFFSYTCMSRGEFNRVVLDNYFLQIAGDLDFYNKIFRAVEHNKKEKSKYQKMINKIDFSQSEMCAKNTKIPLKVYCFIENKIYNDMILPNPVIDIEIICRKEYTTPVRHTHVFSDSCYNYKQLLQFYEKSKQITGERIIRTEQIKYERSLMTDSLRYDVLRRDGFRCQICGSTAQDGVKLHVDHIIPISKGGRTELSNLRALCDRCNWGKKDKIE